MTPPDQSKLSRRGFLVAITGSALAAAAGCRPDGQPAPTIYAPGSATTSATTSAPTATPGSAAAATTPVLDPKYGKLTYDKTILTPTDSLYVTQYDYNNTPNVDAATWKLVIDGKVDKPLSLTLDEIKAMPSTKEIRTLECISDPVGGTLIGNLMWKGVLFSEILKQLTPAPEVTHVRFEAADNYSTSVKLEWMTQPGVLLAYDMNDEPLTTVHGFPLRLHIPGLYGQKMPRWLTRIEFIDYDYTGYWEGRGWSNTADIRTRSAIRLPSDSGTAQAGSQIYIQGIAFAGKRKITQVEVQIDGGDWMPATLVENDGPLAWTQWYVTWTLPAPGTYRIGVRATDETGFVQSEEAAGLFGGAFPNGTDAIHRLTMQGA